MAKKAAQPHRRDTKNYPSDVAPHLRPDDTNLPITDTERALFATCFGPLIDKILAECA